MPFPLQNNTKVTGYYMWIGARSPNIYDPTHLKFAFQYSFASMIIKSRTVTSGSSLAREW